MTHKKSKTSENDFKKLDRLAHGITPEKMSPLSREQRRRWQVVLGRPKKLPGDKAVPTLITVEPILLRRIDARAKKTGVSRSQFFCDAVRDHLGLIR